MFQRVSGLSSDFGNETDGSADQWFNQDENPESVYLRGELGGRSPGGSR